MLNKYGTSIFEFIDDMFIMDDFMEYIDRSAIFFRLIFTVSMALSTPAQNPRGDASSTLYDSLTWSPFCQSVILAETEFFYQ